MLSDVRFRAQMAPRTQRLRRGLSASFAIGLGLTASAWGAGPPAQGATEGSAPGPSVAGTPAGEAASVKQAPLPLAPGKVTHLQRWGEGQVSEGGSFQLTVAVAPGRGFVVAYDAPTTRLLARAGTRPFTTGTGPSTAPTSAPVGAGSTPNSQEPSPAEQWEASLPTDTAGRTVRYTWGGLKAGGALLELHFGGEAPYRVLLLVDPAGTGAPRLLLKGRTGALESEIIEISQTGPRDARTVYLARSPREPNLCGRRVPSRVEKLDPAAGEFRPVAVPVLSAAERRAARPAGVQAFSGPEGAEVEISLDPILGGSVQSLGKRTVDTQRTRPAAPHEALEIPTQEIGRPRALLLHTSVVDAALGGPPDGDGAPGAGHGTPADGTTGPAFGERGKESAGGGSDAEPELHLLVGDSVFGLQVPLPLPAVVAVPIPEGGDESCLALAFGAVPWVVEVTALVPSPELSGKSVTDWAAALGAASGDLAARALALRGQEALAALLDELRQLSPLGRRRAEKVAQALGLEAQVAVDAELVAFGSEAEVERALTRLGQAGDAGAQALVRALSDARPLEEARLAEGVARLWPERAPELLLDRLNQPSPARRLEIRRVLADVCAESAVRRRAEGLLLDRRKTRRSRSELARTLAPDATELSPEGRRAILALLETARFHEAYRLAGVLVELTRTEAAARQLAQSWLLGSGPEFSPKERAALQLQLLGTALEVGMALEGGTAQPVFPAAARELLQSPEMRVRRVSAQLLRADPQADALEGLAERLRGDDWPEVRAEAVLALGHLRPEAATAERADKLTLSALARDADPMVRAAAAHALDQAPTEQSRQALRRGLAKDDSPLVRAEAARSLGLVCDHASLEPLTQAARGLRAGAAEEAQVRLGLEAVTAVSRLGPPDLEQRLEPLLQEDVPGMLRARVEQAISVGKGACAVRSAQ